MLDAREYLHLAVNASQKGDHHASMEYLHKCLEQEPKNSDALYLLAAEHAEIGLLDRAVDGMERAIAIDPAQEMAVFQVSLLYMAKGDLRTAEEKLRALNKQTQDAALRQYSTAMLHLVANETNDAVREITVGLDQNYGNPHLDTTMRNVLATLEKQQVQTKQQDTAEAEKPASKSVFLGAYKDKKLSDS